MSIERSGPEGYEYQYLVTTYISIRKIKEKNIKIFVEKEKGEDAEILYKNDGISMKYEIQVKGTRSDIGMKELVSWLHHFPDRESEENLLSRLIDNPQSLCFFFTRGRCKDEIKNFVSLNSLIPHENSPLKQKSIVNYINELKRQYNYTEEEATELKRKRDNYCLHQQKSFEKDKSILKEVAKRIIIFEMQEDELLKQNLYHLLNEEYLVPQNQTKFVLDELIKLVVRARDDKSDLSVEFINLLRRYSAKQVFTPELDIRRPELQELTKCLEENHILLLTGISFCGKTHLAKQVASVFQKKGYNCLEEKDVSIAIRFLSENTVEERLCILEDPFGHINLEENIEELWSDLEDFSRKIKPHRKIIITSKKDLITSYHENQEITECYLGEQAWFDLTFKNKEVALKLWEGYSFSKELNPSLITKVRELISAENEDYLLQPGQIRYLALNINKYQKNISKDEMIELATIDARKITQYYKLQSSEYKKIITVLGLGANTISPIAEKEIAHILSSEDDFPSVSFLEEDDFLSIEYDSIKTYPEYQEEYTLEDNLTDILDDLAARGYISINKDGVRFIHPTFLEASKLLYFNYKKRSELRWLFELFKKTIASLNSSVALTAAKQLKTLYNRLSSNSKAQGELIDIAYKTMESIFPSVRDEAIIFLINISNDLSLDNQEKLFHRLNNKPVPETDLMWKDGKPWIKSNIAGYSIHDLGRAFASMFPIDEKVFKNYRDKLLQDTEDELSLENMWELLISFNSYELTNNEAKKMLIKMMFVNEAFIRGGAAYFLLGKFGEDQDLVELVLTDSHPYVQYQGIRGIFKGWNLYSSSIRELLIHKINEAFYKPSLSVTAHQFMIDIGGEHGNNNIGMYDMNIEEKKNIWNLWASIFPEFLENLPRIWLNESDLYMTFLEADKYLSNLKLTKVLKSWLNWINKNLIKRSLSDYALGIAEVILTSKTMSKKSREDFLDPLLGSEDTSFIVTSLVSYVDHWVILSQKEKDYIFSLLKSKRKDIQWLKAISLTRKHVPIVIQELLLEGLNFHSSSGEEILNELPENLIHDCLSVYYGYPDYLGWLGLSRTENLFWDNLKFVILKKPEHSSFNLVMREWTDQMTNGLYRDNDKQRNLHEWRIICSHESERVRETAFHYLLQWSSRKVGVIAEELWRIFLEENDIEFGKYVKEIIATISTIEDRNKNLRKVFGEDIFYQKIFPEINPDYLLFKTLPTIKKLELEETKGNLMLSFVRRIFEIELPKLLITIKIIEKQFENLDYQIAKEVKNLVDKSLKEIEHNVEIQYKKFDEYDKLENWLTLRE